MVRGPGKFKQKRGGGRNFSKHLELNEAGVAVATPRRRGDEEEEDDDDDDDDEEDDDDDDEDEDEDEETTATTASSAPQSSRKAEKKAQPQGNAEGDEEQDPDLVNPNHAPMKNLSLADVGAPRQMSRRERLVIPLLHIRITSNVAL